MIEHALTATDVRIGTNVRQLRESFGGELPQVLVYASIFAHGIVPHELKRLCDDVKPVPVIVHVEIMSIAQIKELMAAGVKAIVPLSVSMELAAGIIPFVAAGGTYFPPLENTPGQRPFNKSEKTPHLTPKQVSVLRLAIDGQSNKEIARQLGVAENTIKFHIASLTKKLKVRNRVQLARVASHSLGA
jgi:two-component system nitrate/nitrite response regulator NarL